MERTLVFAELRPLMPQNPVAAHLMADRPWQAVSESGNSCHVFPSPTACTCTRASRPWRVRGSARGPWGRPCATPQVLRRQLRAQPPPARAHPAVNAEIKLGHSPGLVCAGPCNDYSDHLDYFVRWISCGHRHLDCRSGKGQTERGHRECPYARAPDHHSQRPANRGDRRCRGMGAPDPAQRLSC